MFSDCRIVGLWHELVFREEVEEEDGDDTAIYIDLQEKCRYLWYLFHIFFSLIFTRLC